MWPCHGQEGNAGGVANRHAFRTLPKPLGSDLTAPLGTDTRPGEEVEAEQAQIQGPEQQGKQVFMTAAVLPVGLAENGRASEGMVVAAPLVGALAPSSWAGPLTFL